MIDWLVLGKWDCGTGSNSMGNETGKYSNAAEISSALYVLWFLFLAGTDCLFCVRISTLHDTNTLWAGYVSLWHLSRSVEVAFERSFRLLL